MSIVWYQQDFLAQNRGSYLAVWGFLVSAWFRITLELLNLYVQEKIVSQNWWCPQSFLQRFALHGVAPSMF